MLSKATALTDFVYPTLQNSKEALYTRIQALIMQNMTDLDSTHDWFDGYTEWLRNYDTPDPKLMKMNITRRIIRFWRQYSLSKEIELLCIRIPKVAKVFKQ